MKGKKNTYILLILVLAIWGVIGYRMVAAFGPDENHQIQNNFDVSFKPKVFREQDSFTIHNYERDPFLGSFKKPLKKKQKTTVVKPKVIWPEITYSGAMGDTKNIETIFFISINNTQYLMKKKDENMGVVLLKGTENNIIVRFEGNKKTISIKQ